MATQLFLSHASADRDLASIVCEHVLIGSAGCSPDQVFAAHVDGHGPRVGQPWWPTLRAAAMQARCFAFLVTPSFLTSSFCFAEAGAWLVSEVEAVPILVGDIDPGDPRLAVLPGLQTVSLRSGGADGAVLASVAAIADTVAQALGTPRAREHDPIAASMLATLDVATSERPDLEAGPTSVGAQPLPIIELDPRSDGEAELRIANLSGGPMDVRIEIEQTDGCYLADPAALEGRYADGEQRSTAVFRSAGYSRIRIGYTWGGADRQQWLSEVPWKQS